MGSTKEKRFQGQQILLHMYIAHIDAPGRSVGDRAGRISATVPGFNVLAHVHMQYAPGRSVGECMISESSDKCHRARL